MTVWYESESFWRVMSPILFSPQRWQDAAVEVDKIIKLVSLEKGAVVLDMGCGPGRHSVELARRGFSVTGVDKISFLLDEAKQVAHTNDLTIEFVQEDLRQFCRPESFDVALSMFTSFGYFESLAENQQVLINVRRSLKKNGILIIDMMGKEILAHIFKERDWDEIGEIFFLQERKLSRNWSWMESRWLLLGESERYDFSISYWIYSASELTTMLKECGFCSVEVCGNLSGAPYDHTAERLVAIAHK